MSGVKRLCEKYIVTMFTLKSHLAPQLSGEATNCLKSPDHASTGFQHQKAPWTIDEILLYFLLIFQVLIISLNKLLNKSNLAVLNFCPHFRI